MVIRKIFYCYFALRWSRCKLQTTVVTLEDQILPKAVTYLNIISEQVRRRQILCLDHTEISLQEHCYYQVKTAGNKEP